MDIYVGHSNDIDFKNELYRPIRKAFFESKHNIVLPHENSLEPFNSRDYLESCDLFIAEVSSKSIGLGIELGWANLMNVKIICFYKKGFKPSSSLKVITDNFVEYEDSHDFINKLKNIIQ